MVGKRFIAFADILGFKSLLRKSPLEEIAASISSLIDATTSLKIPWIKVMREGYTEEQGQKTEGEWRPHSLHFSDTIVLWTEVLPDFQSLERSSAGFMFAHTLATLVQRAFVIGIPLRVGIAFGEIYIDESRNIIVGQPLVDAYLLEEAQDWVGGAFHSSVPLQLMNRDGGAIEYTVPLKSSHSVECCAALDWCFPFAFNPDEKLLRSNQEYAQRAFTSYLQQEMDENVKAKYMNARRFYESRLATGAASPGSAT